MSTIKASNIQNGSSSSVNIALNTDGSATFAQMPVGPTSYLRNRIINGEMRTDQRNGGSSVTPASGAYTLDRWAVEMTQSSKFSVQQNAGGVTPPTGFTTYLGVTSLSAYSVISSDYFIISQGIEGVNIYDWAWGTAAATPVTLSFWVRSSVTGTYGGTFTNNGASRNYIFSYTINVANTWEYKTVTVPGDVTGTWVTNVTAAGVYVRFCFGAGASTQGAVGWTGSVLRTVTGQASVVGTNGATFYVTGVQVEVGSVATPFERRLYSQELAMCQRYYIQNASVNGIWINNTQLRQIYQMPVTMRTNPTVTIIEPNAYHEWWNQAAYTGVSGISTVAAIRSVDFTLTSSSNRGRNYGDPSLIGSNSVGISAEL